MVRGHRVKSPAWKGDLALTRCTREGASHRGEPRQVKWNLGGTQVRKSQRKERRREVNIDKKEIMKKGVNQQRRKSLGFRECVVQRQKGAKQKKSGKEDEEGDGFWGGGGGGQRLREKGGSRGGKELRFKKNQEPTVGGVKKWLQKGQGGGGGELE